MSGIWFTSDLHIGHATVATTRGFDDVSRHDEVLAIHWDAAVRPGDQVWVLGDICMSSRGRSDAEDRALEWISERPGIKHLIAGNHDGCHPMHREAHKSQRRFLEVFESVQQSGVRKIAGERVKLSHFPFDRDHTTEIRYPEWRFLDDGGVLIHGHTHGEMQVHYSESTKSLQLHVGVDAHGLRPVPLSWVEQEITDFSEMRGR
ncbi:metallophosphoesterase [Nocardia sp. NPDC057440]|uniref:metallophosphoesterase n=1 Tax=Nocardia sp. NPDC057440 TaxID=3346134 RepID=UPI00366F585B